MKFYKKLNVYKSGKGMNNVYYPEKEEAYSYSWYCYAKYLPKVGWIINACSYSSTTSKHISKFLSLKGYPKTKYVYAPKGLTNKDAAIKYYENAITELLNKMNMPGTRKSKNIERAAQVLQFKESIKFVNKYL